MKLPAGNREIRLSEILTLGQKQVTVFGIFTKPPVPLYIEHAGLTFNPARDRQTPLASLGYHLKYVLVLSAFATCLAPDTARTYIPCRLSWTTSFSSCSCSSPLCFCSNATALTLCHYPLTFRHLLCSTRPSSPAMTLPADAQLGPSWIFYGAVWRQRLRAPGCPCTRTCHGEMKANGRY